MNGTANSELPLRDIICKVPPVNNSVVRKMITHLRRGKKLPPIEVEPSRREHWVKAPDGPICLGVGFGLVHGRHRLTAMKVVYGEDFIAPVKKIETTADLL